MSLVPSDEVIKALDAKAAMEIIGNKQEYLIYKIANSFFEEAKTGTVSQANDPMQMMLGFMLGKSIIDADFREKEKEAIRRMDVPLQALPPGRQFCQKCGSSIGSADKFCSSCGAKLKDEL